MSTLDPSNTNASAQPSDVAMHLAYAEACVVLVECLMHVMVEKKLLPKDELIAAVESAMATKQAMANANWHRDLAPVAAGVLAQIANSLRALPCDDGLETRATGQES
jgi:hypothetical protein